MHENDIAKTVVDCCYHIHTKLGPGLLESVYEEVLVYELEKRMIAIQRQRGIPVLYDTVSLELGFRADLIVEDKVIIELKSVESVLPVHKKQLLTYLKLSGKKLGLLINFKRRVD